MMKVNKILTVIGLIGTLALTGCSSNEVVSSSEDYTPSYNEYDEDDTEDQDDYSTDNDEDDEAEDDTDYQPISRVTEELTEFFNSTQDVYEVTGEVDGLNVEFKFKYVSSAAQDMDYDKATIDDLLDQLGDMVKDTYDDENVYVGEITLSVYSYDNKFLTLSTEF